MTTKETIEKIFKTRKIRLDDYWDYYHDEFEEDDKS